MVTYFHMRFLEHSVHKGEGGRGEHLSLPTMRVSTAGSAVLAPASATTNFVAVSGAPAAAGTPCGACRVK